jgi:hypothetical protein
LEQFYPFYRIVASPADAAGPQLPVSPKLDLRPSYFYYGRTFTAAVRPAGEYAGPYAVADMLAAFLFLTFVAEGGRK